MDHAEAESPKGQPFAHPNQLRPLTRRARALLCCAWMSPVLLVPFGWFFQMGVLQIIVHPGTVAHVMLGWVSFGANVIALWSLIIVVIVCYGACFEMWRRVERWRNPRGAVRRALIRMPVIIAINVASLFGIGWVAALVGSLVN